MSNFWSIWKDTAGKYKFKCCHLQWNTADVNFRDILAAAAPPAIECEGRRTQDCKLKFHARLVLKSDSTGRSQLAESERTGFSIRFSKPRNERILHYAWRVTFKQVKRGVQQSVVISLEKCSSYCIKRGDIRSAQRLARCVKLLYEWDVLCHLSEYEMRARASSFPFPSFLTWDRFSFIAVLSLCISENQSWYFALTKRHEEPVEGRVGVDPPEDDDGGEVADHAEEADDEQRHALDPELHAAHEVAGERFNRNNQG